MTNTTRFALAAVTAAATASAASAALITFDDGMFSDDGTTVTSMGFNFAGTTQTGADEDVIVEAVGMDNRVRAEGFDDNLILTADGGAPFTLTSFDLSNFTFNASHTHSVTVEYNFADGSPQTSATFTVGGAIPGDRTMEATFTPNLMNLSSVRFLNGPTDGDDPTADARLFFLDSVNATVIPEPASAAAAGLIGLVALRRRR